MGNRTISSNTAAESINQSVIVALLIEMYFGSQTLYITNASQTITYGGNDYIPDRGLGSISAVEEASEVSSPQVTFSISGIPSSNISKALADTYQGKEVNIKLAFLTNDYSVYDEPLLVYKGEMDNMELQIGKEASITVNSYSILSTWEVPKRRFYNSEDQKHRYPNDKGFDLVEKLAYKNLTWTPKR